VYVFAPDLLEKKQKAGSEAEGVKEAAQVIGEDVCKLLILHERMILLMMGCGASGRLQKREREREREREL
jgi:hypothetical protein